MRSAAEYGKVAVLYGGWSAEREVSLDSGTAVLAALQAQDVDAVGVDATPQRLLGLAAEGFDRAFIILHGRGGEDGVAQAILQAQGLPFTGSGLAASALGMDKSHTKSVWRDAGLPTPASKTLYSQQDCEGLAGELGLPLFIKPAHEGSSVGMSKVTAADELVSAFEKAAGHDPAVLAEQFIDGPEYTVAILDGQVLPIIRIQAASDFYDYQAKYKSDQTLYHCPCGLTDAQEQAFGQVALRAFNAVGVTGWGRVDFMLDTQGRQWLLEVNTVPGMTSHSLVPMAAKQAGMDFDQLVLRILDTSFDYGEGGQT